MKEIKCIVKEKHHKDHCWGKWEGSWSQTWKKYISQRRTCINCGFIEEREI